MAQNSPHMEQTLSSLLSEVDRTRHANSGSMANLSVFCSKNGGFCLEICRFVVFSMPGVDLNYFYFLNSYPDRRLRWHGFCVDILKCKFRTEHDLPLDESRGDLGLDPNHFILCGKCVYVCSHEFGRAILDFTHRGMATIIGTFDEQPLAQQNCQGCVYCARVKKIREEGSIRLTASRISNKDVSNTQKVEAPEPGSAIVTQQVWTTAAGFTEII